MFRREKINKLSFIRTVFWVLVPKASFSQRISRKDSLQKGIGLKPFLLKPQLLNKPMNHSLIHIRKAYKLILSRLKEKEHIKSYDRRSYRRQRRRLFNNNHRELPDVKIGGLKHDNIVSYQTRLQTIKCFHLNEILFHVLGKF